MDYIIMLILGIAIFSSAGLAVVYRFRLSQLEKRYKQLLKEISQYK